MLLIQSKRFKLRTLNEKDNLNIFSYASNPVISKFLAWETHCCINDTNDYLARSILLAKKYPMSSLGIIVTINNSDILIGSIGLLAKHFSSPYTFELGYVLHHEWWGKGFALEAVITLLKYAFANNNIERVEAFCVAENIRSWKLLEKIGMIREGTRRNFFYKNNNFQSVYMYSLLKSEWNGFL